MFNHLVPLVTVALLAVSSAFDKIPDYLLICHGSDPRRDECTARSAQQLDRRFDVGIPELDLPSLNPLLLNDFVVSPKASGLLLNLEDMRIYNAHNFTVTNSSNPVWYEKMIYHLTFPRFYINGTYNVNGQLVLLQLEGRGAAEIIVEDLVAEFYIDHDSSRRSDQSPYISKFVIKIRKYKSASVHMSNLFGGDPELGKTINAAINQNIDVFSAELMPLIEKRLAKAMRKTINKFLAHFSREQMFPL